MFFIDSGNCAVLNPASKEYEFTDCFEGRPFVCQVDQTPNEMHKEKMGWQPFYVHPMDNITKIGAEKWVGFMDIPVRETEMSRSSSFIQASIMTDMLPSNFTTEKGFSIGFWLKQQEDDTREQNIVIIDNHLFIKLKDGKPTIVIDDSGQTEEIVGHVLLTYDQWYFIGFTYSTDTKEAHLYVDETYGLDGEEGHFKVLTDNIWFGKEIEEEFLGFEIQFSGPTFEEGFKGEISCVQIYNIKLNPAQMYQISKICHVPKSYKRGKSCPPDFHLIGDECYKFMEKSDFLSAELACTAEANADYVTRLGFPLRHQHQQDLSILTHQLYSTDAFFLGLDTKGWYNNGCKKIIIF